MKIVVSFQERLIDVYVPLSWPWTSYWFSLILPVATANIVPIFSTVFEVISWMLFCGTFNALVCFKAGFVWPSGGFFKLLNS